MKSDLCHLTFEKPPEFLFIATSVEDSYKAFQKGINRRKSLFVEMYQSEYEARNEINGQPSMFTILSGVMAEEGHRFYHAETGEWLTDEIPARYLRIS